MSTTAEIWSDSASAPSAKIGTASTAVLASAFPATEADQAFVSISAAITSGTKYWVVLHAAVTSDNTNYPLWYFTGTFSTTGDLASANGTSWGAVNNRTLKFTLYQ